LDRRGEIAVRAALGAGRMRILRQLAIEGTLLSLAGAAAGLVLAVWGIDSALALAAGRIPRQEEIVLDARVFAFALVLSLLTGAFFGILPALHAFRADLASSLQVAGRT